MDVGQVLRDAHAVGERVEQRRVFVKLDRMELHLLVEDFFCYLKGILILKHLKLILISFKYDLKPKIA